MRYKLITREENDWRNLHVRKYRLLTEQSNLACWRFSMESNQILKIVERIDINPKSVEEIGCGAGEILTNCILKYPVT